MSLFADFANRKCAIGDSKWQAAHVAHTSVFEISDLGTRKAADLKGGGSRYTLTGGMPVAIFPPA